MSKHDFFMIAIGAAIGLVINGVGKWLFGIFDAVVPVSKAPEKVKATFSIKANRGLLWSILWILWMVGATIGFAVDKSPVTRLSILNGSMYLCGLTVAVTNLMWNIFLFLRYRKSVKAGDDTSP
jgi:hypothetical protein